MKSLIYQFGRPFFRCVLCVICGYEARGWGSSGALGVFLVLWGLGGDRESSGKNREFSGKIGNSREFSGILGVFGILGNSREFSGILGNSHRPTRLEVSHESTGEFANPPSGSYLTDKAGEPTQNALENPHRRISDTFSCVT